MTQRKVNESVFTRSEEPPSRSQFAQRSQRQLGLAPRLPSSPAIPGQSAGDVMATLWEIKFLLVGDSVV